MKKRFDKGFKTEAVKLVLDSKRPVAAVAGDVGTMKTYCTLSQVCA